MKSFEERKAEIFRRSKQRLAKRKGMRRRAWLIGSLFIVTVVCTALGQASPGSRPTESRPANSSGNLGYWEGVPTTDFYPEKKSSLRVLKADVMFDIPEFPAGFNKLENVTAYSSQVTATYLFENPTDEVVTTPLRFPFGKQPFYLYLEDTPPTLPWLAEFYSLSVNGEEITPTIRTAPIQPGEDTPLLSDEYVSHPFYIPDLPVTKYTYTVSGVDPQHTEATASFNWSATENEAKVMLTTDYKSSLAEYHTRLFTKAVNGQSVTVYVFGKGAKPAWIFYRDSSKETVIDGTMTLTDTKETTLKEFAKDFCKPELNAAEVDWYNAVVAALLESDQRNGVIRYEIMEDVLLRSSEYWQEYPLTLQPGEKVTVVATAPLYPTMYYWYEPTVYTYTHRIYAFFTWMQPEELTVTVNTPYYLTEGLEGYEKTDTGYTQTMQGLEKDRLVFSLSTVETPLKENWDAPSSEVHFPSSFPFQLFEPIAIIAGGLLLVFVVEAIIHRSKKE